MKSVLFALKWALIGLGAASLIIAVIATSGRSDGILDRMAGISGRHLLGTNHGYADAVARAAPAVVSIHAVSQHHHSANPEFEDPLLEEFFGTPAPRGGIAAETSLGSGVILDRSGILVTNYHVVQGALAILVSLHDGRRAAAEVVGIDPDTDLAVLRIQLDDLPSIEIGDSDALRVGDVVLAIGNPLGIGQTVTQGIVSATGRNRIGINTFENFIQTDAAINFGNSGGALIDGNGALVGINSVRVDSEGIGFAIPTSIGLKVAQQIVDSGSVERGWIGIDARDLTPSLRKMLGADSGIVVLGVMPKGPADAAGIRAGDVVTHIKGAPIADSRMAIEHIAALAPGARIAVRGLRARAGYETEVVVSRRPTAGD